MPKIYIRGEVQVEAKRVPLDALKLDPNNVRFKHIDTVLTDAEIEELIWKEPDTRDLLKSIQVSGGLMEHPVVGVDYIVREGNRRTVALRKLKNLAHEGKVSEWPEDRFDMVECDFLPEGVNPVDVDIYLALVHVKGKKPWARLNQASHIYNLYQNLGQSYDLIRDHLGMGKRTVQTLNWAYEATTKYLQKFDGKPGCKADINDFVFFDQLYKRKELREWLDADSGNLARFGEWVATQKIKDPSRELTWLPKILKSRDALDVLEKEGMEKAKEVLQRRNPALGSKTFSLMDKAFQALQAMPRSEYRTLHEDEARLDLLRRLRDEINEVLEGGND